MGQNKKGFTLLELLVVIAIIGVLSTVVLASLNAARVKARDAKRMEDLRSIQAALQLYWTDNGHYPPEGHCLDSSIGISDASGCPAPSPAGAAWAATSDLQNLISGGYIDALPIDPVNDSTYFYRYESNNAGQGIPPCTVNTCSYSLCANRLEGSGSQYCVSQ